MKQFQSVLIIDNDPTCIFLQKRQIEKANIAAEIHTASNGEEAIDFLVNYYRNNESLPEVIFSDIQMPTMNGVEFIQRLKKLPFYKAEEVILATLSSTENIEILQKVKAEGVKFLFQKPMIQDYLKFIRLAKIRRLRLSLYNRIFGNRNSFLSA
jgi:CheY-like chemotaxis protein